MKDKTVHVMCLLKIICFAILLTPVASALALNESQTDRSMEAQRNYDLAVSYIKSDLYEDGLKTLNQVAFLYPDSDVADDALYQLALIREQVGDGQITIGEKRSIDAVSEELQRLTGYIRNDIIVYLNAVVAGTLQMKEAQNRAITQYILALDYLTTLTQRYPDSGRIEDTRNAVNRIIKKIEAMNPKPTQKKEKEPLSKGCSLAMTALGTGVLLFIIIASISRL
jgi:outer membrane protein assembly factor BamD (BamD/ComL family)